MAQSMGEVLREAQEKLAEMEAFIQQVTTPPLGLAIVLTVSGKEVVIASGEKPLVVEMPKFSVQPGDLVVCAMDSSQIIRLASEHNAISESGAVSAVVSVEGPKLHIESAGGLRQILRGSLSEVDSGDRVILDPTGTVAICNIGKDERFALDHEISVTWADVGAQDEAVQAMRELIEYPIKHEALYKAYGMSRQKGILLSGPPGCGKTLLGKAAANALAKLYKKAKGAFMHIKGPEVLNKYWGQTEANIRGIFANARDFAQKKGHPALLFVDEADALLRARGRGSSAGELNDTSVAQFLSEMDGLEESGTIVILATNRPDLLDPAVTRDGRIDRKVSVNRPDLKGTKEILSIYLKKLPLLKADIKESSSAVADELFSDDAAILNVQLKDGKYSTLLLRDVVSGALIESVVKKATMRALARDIGTNKAKGVVADDLSAAVQQIKAEQFTTNHEDTVIAKFGKENVKAIQRLAA